VKLWAKSAVWGIPILIGLYQLIAIQYFTLNPYLPLAAYIIALFVIYLFLKSVTGIKCLYLFAKANKLHFISRFATAIMVTPVVIIMLISPYITHKFDIGFILFATIMLILLIPFTFMLIKDTIGESKSDLIQKELDDLAIKYGVKE
jgi:hypothetical protein